jgi:hypothetical protein
MKKQLSVALAALAISIVSGAALAEAKQDFTLVNKTGYVIEEVYVAPNQSNDWLNDVLGQDTLGDSEYVKIKFKHSNSICKYDLKVVYDDKSEVEWTNINLCEEEKLTIHWNKKSQETSVTYD